MSAKKRRQAISSRAKLMAVTLVEVLQEGGIFEAIAEAGKRIDKQEEHNHQCMKLLDAFMAGPENEEKQRAVEEAETAHAVYEYYRNFRNKGEAHPEYLKAMDFDGHLEPEAPILQRMSGQDRLDYKKGTGRHVWLRIPAKDVVPIPRAMEVQMPRVLGGHSCVKQRNGQTIQCSKVGSRSSSPNTGRMSLNGRKWGANQTSFRGRKEHRWLWRCRPGTENGCHSWPTDCRPSWTMQSKV